MASTVWAYVRSLLQPLTPAPNESIFIRMPIVDQSELRDFCHIESREVPPIPADLLNAWENEDCPFWPEKRLHETHMLILIPHHGKEQPINLTSLLTQAQQALSGSAQCIKPFLLEPIEEVLRKEKQSYWALVTQKPVPESCGLTVEGQKKLIAEQTREQYEMVSTMEAVLVCLAAASKHLCLFGPNINACTRCVETLDNTQLCVGASVNGTIMISQSMEFFRPIGAAAARKSAL